MKYIVLLTLMLLGAIALTGDAPDISIRDFSGGMNTKDGLFQVKPNQCYDAYNTDFGETPGSFAKRRGYVQIGRVAGAKHKLYGLYNYTSPSRRRLLMGIIPFGGDTTLGKLVNTPNLSYTFDTNTVYKYVHPHTLPFWATWKSYVFMANGLQKPVVWRDSNGTLAEKAIELGGTAPGAFKATSINKTGGPNGLYYYLIDQTSPPCSTTGWSGYPGAVVGPVSANQQNIALWGFNRLAWCNACSAAIDTMTTFRIGRSRGNVTIDQSTPFYYFKTVSLGSKLADTFFVDTLRDESLGAGSYTAYGTIPPNTYLLEDYRMGRPELKSTDTAAATTDRFTGVTVYGVAFMDTLLDVESDTGITLWIVNGNKDSCYHLWLPKIPSTMSNTVRVLYRGYSDGDRIIALYARDTIVSDTQQNFADNMEYDTLILRTAFTKNAVVNFNGVVTIGDRLWGWKGSNIYYSRLDSATQWDAFSFVSFNKDDGEDISVIVPHRGDVIVYKPSMSFILYEDASGNFTKQWQIPNVGCVAPHSMVSVGDMRIYLAKNGVYKESGLPYKDRGGSLEKISEPIDNLLNYPISIKKTAVGFLNDDDEYWLSFPGRDTTYVYDIFRQAYRSAILF